MTEVSSGERMTLECLTTYSGSTESMDTIRTTLDPAYPGGNIVQSAYLGIGQGAFVLAYDMSGGINVAAHVIGHGFTLVDNSPNGLTPGQCGQGLMGYCWIGNAASAQLQSPTADELADLHRNFASLPPENTTSTTTGLPSLRDIIITAAAAFTVAAAVAVLVTTVYILLPTCTLWAARKRRRSRS
jgi:hypothetical protein